MQRTTTLSRRVATGAALTLLIICAGMAPAVSSAQTYTPYFYPPSPYTQATVSQPMTQQQMIAYLYQLIAQLQAQLALQQGGGYQYGVGQPTYVPYQPYGYDIEVETDDADGIEEDSAELAGEVDLDGAPYADVWFEYGNDSRLDERSDRERIDRSGDDSHDFEITVDDLDEDELYFFRAVAEGSDGYRTYGTVRSFRTDDDGGSSNRDGDAPEVDLDTADNVDEDSAELAGEVDMNDFEDGRVFFLYGTDEDAIEDATDEDSYGDIDTDDPEILKFSVDSSLEGTEDYAARIFNLDDDTDYFFTLCVEYEDDDGDDTLECAPIEEFTTDEN